MFKKVVDGIEFYAISNDVNGNPRYVFHFLNLSDTYAEAARLAKILGARKYRGKNFAGGFAIQSYSLKADAIIMNQLKKHGKMFEKELKSEVEKYKKALLLKKEQQKNKREQRKENLKKLRSN